MKDIYILDNNNITQTQIEFNINEEIINKFPLFKNIIPTKFSFYNNVFNDINIFTQKLIDNPFVDCILFCE